MIDLLKKLKFLHKAILDNFKISETNEIAISKYFKIPLALYCCDDKKNAEKVFKHLIVQTPNYDEREFDTYYNCWLYIYAKLSGQKESADLYKFILKNKRLSGGVSSRKFRNPELRATAITCLCACIENDLNNINDMANYVCKLFDLNKNKLESSNFFFMECDNALINNSYPQKDERLYTLKTIKAKPLTYSFSLAIIGLSYAHAITNDIKYLEYAKKYADFLLTLNYKNDYIGKSVVAFKMLYKKCLDKKYLLALNNMLDYIDGIVLFEGECIHDGQFIPHDRLSEYTIALCSCKDLQRGK